MPSKKITRGKGKKTSITASHRVTGKERILLVKPLKPDPCHNCRDTGFTISCAYVQESPGVVGGLGEVIRPTLEVIICSCQSGKNVVAGRIISIPLKVVGKFR